MTAGDSSEGSGNSDNQGEPGADSGHVYTESELEGLTKSDIAELAASLGYTVSTNDTKAEMIAAFLQQQGGGSSTEPEPSTPEPDPETGTGSEPDPGTGSDPEPGTGSEPDPGPSNDPDPESGSGE